MSEPSLDLRILTRSPAAGGSPPGAPGTRVPMPRLHWRTRILLPAAILLTTAGLLAYAAHDTWRPATPVHVVPVIAKTDVGAQPAGAVIVQAPGWVEADPFPTAVSALADGVVAEVLVLEGEHVAPGQVVARLVDTDARIALAQAEAHCAERRAALAATEAALAEARSNWDNPIELERRLAVATARRDEKHAELERWPAELAREEARAVYLQAEYERIRPLHEQGRASDIERVQSQQAHRAQQAEVEAVRRRRPVLEAQLRALEAEVQAAADELRLRIADTRALAEAQAAVQRAQAALAAAEAARDEARLRLERMEVRAPTGGIVMSRLVEPGSKLVLSMDNPRSAQVVRLYDPRRLQVRVDIPLADAARVGVGQPAEVRVDVLPDRVFAGRVTRIVHEADVQKNTLQVKVALADPAPDLKPEMLARARFLALPQEDAAGPAAAAGQRVFVPRAALRERDGQRWVWLADQVAGAARRRPVTPGTVERDGWAEILEGVQPGDRVITDAPADLTDGQRIRIAGEARS